MRATPRPSRASSAMAGRVSVASRSDIWAAAPARSPEWARPWTSVVAELAESPPASSARRAQAVASAERWRCSAMIASRSAAGPASASPSAEPAPALMPPAEVAWDQASVRSCSASTSEPWARASRPST